MTYLVLSLTLLTVTLSACAQLAFKLGVTKPTMASALQSSITESLLAAAISPFIWVGLIIYGLSVAMWLWVLSKVELSVAYPFVGVSFLVTMAFSALLLNETLTPTRVFGTVLIACGCVLVGKSA
ncbi:EamA family transporter [Endozoicomonas sp. SM1973]|uniref:EamA family transporter n=1 Tax=Spartinivicinus marinus TaxID=2994442 RepID=A0A853I6A2_9GAMM|nr:EamA family transporter [Spartinivicinus marinus]MCX4028126.1 EamA family transporter [Spartinivicinus marinus]NYZ66198.1 EamA family transporter [Spartinivicinus marinus]